MRTKFHYLFVKNICKAYGVILLIGVISACSSVKEVPAVEKEKFTSSTTSTDSIIATIPNYSDNFLTVKGKGKAIVSEPENSERVTLYFSSNRQKSLITIKNSLGIEGGKLLTDGDTLLVYNKIDNYAQKIPVQNKNLDNINNLASINILGILNVPVAAGEVNQVLENESNYLLQLKTGSTIYVNKDDLLIEQIDRPPSSALPYSQIKYDGYEKVDGLKIPRRITIFSADKSAKIDLLIQSLEINPSLGELAIDLPDDIKIYRQ